MNNYKIAIIMPDGIQYDYCINNFLSSDLNIEIIFRFGSVKESLKQKLKNTFKRVLIFHPKYKLESIKLRNKFEAKKILKRELSINDKRLSKKQINLVEFSQDKIASELRINKIDIAVIWGCPVLKSQIIEAVSDKIINAHTSLLPYYRGSFSEFWQFFNNDFQHSGITFHVVDSKIDTGEIILQIPAAKSDFKNPQVLRAYNSVRIAKNYVSVLRGVLNFNLVPIKQLQVEDSKTYRMKDITLEKELKVYLK
jgi:phosphoribosylglycinamide formyltransferase-1